MIKCDDCETCGKYNILDRSHFVKKNSVHKTKLHKYDYESDKNYFYQCRACHSQYELLSKSKRYEYMRENGFKKYARRIKYLIEGQNEK